MWCYTIDLSLMADDVCRAYRRAGFKVKSAPFSYSLPIASLQDATGGGLTVSTQIDRDSIFAWLSTACNFKQVDGALQPITWFGAYMIQVRDESTGYRFLRPDKWIPHQAFVGGLGTPYILGFPYLFAPGATVSADFFGRLPPAAGPPGEPAHLSFNGIKIFTKPYTARLILPEVPGLEAL